jgi:multicomponent Na+:H+ antiporter subunit B
VEERRLEVIGFLFLAVYGFLLVYAALGLPLRGPTSQTRDWEIRPPETPSPEAFYIKNAYAVADTPNMVTVILADFRGIDTLGEDAVIFAAGVIGLLLLKRIRKRETPKQ